MQKDIQPPQKNKGRLISTIIVTSLFIIIILVLAFLLYYYGSKSTPDTLEEYIPIIKNKNIQKPQGVSKIVPTDIINFIPPQPLPTVQKTGECFSSSIAQPYRKDAFRCMIGKSIYDPCFISPEKGFVYCQMGIDEATGFLMKLTKPLPKATVPEIIKTNWAWFLKLEDGTECSPFTGDRPVLEDKRAAYYGCDSTSADIFVLLGDLIEGTVWKATMAIIVKQNKDWIIKSSQQVNINTVWK